MRLPGEGQEERTIYGVRPVSPSDVWAVGRTGTVLRWNGKAYVDHGQQYEGKPCKS